jgi:hypothetical protein
MQLMALKAHRADPADGDTSDEEEAMDALGDVLHAVSKRNVSAADAVSLHHASMQGAGATVDQSTADRGKMR